MNQCKTVKVSFIGIFFMTAFSAVGAETIEIDRVFSFSSHTSVNEVGEGGEDATTVADIYTINTDAVVFDNNDYDQLMLTLSPGAGKRFVVDDVASNVRTQVNFRWTRNAGGAGIGSVPYTVTYTNGTGTLPGSDGPSPFSLASDGSWILVTIHLTDVTDSFAFDALTFAGSFGPYPGGGTYAISTNTIAFSYTVPGDVPDPGRFTYINPHSLTTLSTSGGSVTTPGEGMFTYDEGENVNLVATPDAGYHFVNWTGPVADANAASTTVTVTEDTTVTAHFAANGMIEIERVFSFSSHQSKNFVGDEDGDFTEVIDTYTINTSPVVLDGNDYDQMVFTLSPGAGKRFVVDDVSGEVGTEFGFDWRRNPGVGIEGVAYNLAYANGTGTLPGADVGIFGLASDGSWITAGAELTKVADGFAFDAMTIECSFGPSPGGGTYNSEGGEISFTYRIPGVVPDPGRFTQIGSEPDVSTYNALNISGTSATLDGHLVDDGGSPCEGRFRYWIQGQKNATEKITAWQPITDDISAFVDQLLPETTYQYQAEARNDYGSDLGSIKSFTTLTSDPNNLPEPNSPQDANTVYVDDDAPLDPGPNDLNVSDPNEDGTQDHPFDMIQEAIDAASDGQTVKVLSGTYWETVDFKGKSIKVKGGEPNLLCPVIDANYTGTVVTFSGGEDPNTELSGFTLTRGQGELAGGILCTGSDPWVNNCLIVGNRSLFAFGGGGAVYCYDSNAVFVNCTMSGNYGGTFGAGFLSDDSHTVIVNSILWDNSPFEILTTLSGDTTAPVVSYSDVGMDLLGVGNLNMEPQFMQPGYWADPLQLQNLLAPSDVNAVWMDGDYHLLETSPCVDSGDPNQVVDANASDCDGDRRILNNRIDMGVDEFTLNTPQIIALYQDTEIPLALDPNAQDPKHTVIGHVSLTLNLNFKAQLLSQVIPASAAGGDWTAWFEPDVLGPGLDLVTELWIKGEDVDLDVLPIQAEAHVLATVNILAAPTQ